MPMSQYPYDARMCTDSDHGHEEHTVLVQAPLQFVPSGSLWLCERLPSFDILGTKRPHARRFMQVMMITTAAVFIPLTLFFLLIGAHLTLR